MIVNCRNFKKSSITSHRLESSLPYSFFNQKLASQRITKDKTKGHRTPASFDQYDEDFMKEDSEIVLMLNLERQERKIF